MRYWNGAAPTPTRSPTPRSAERVHTLGPGCIILLELLDACGADRLDVCKYGVREGYLIDRMLR